MAFINSIGDVRKSDIPDDDGEIYVSWIDGSYITRVGMEDHVKFLLKRGITEQIQSNDGGGSACIGFNPEEQKWYGWSHRAMYGFGVGSTCKKGDCGYKPETPQKLFDSVTKPDEGGWQWQKPENVELIEDGIRVRTPMVQLIGSDGSEGETAKFISDACDDIVNMDQSVNYIASQPAEPEYWELRCGRGEWTAKTLEEARLMAEDFASGVS